MDQLLATGEQVTIALMAMAIHAQGHEAISFTGGQIGLVTDSLASKARIQSINKQRIFEQLDDGKIVIVAGLPGRHARRRLHDARAAAAPTPRWSPSARCSRPTSARTTPTSTASYTADPRIVPNARKIDRISYDEMLELVRRSGRSVLQTARGRVRQEVQRPASTSATARTITKAPGSSRRPTTWNTSSYPALPSRKT